ncbi:MAG TPA: TonB-dependent receptor plug domain-containing protein, partial [Sphingomonadaceae bacterium]|nr:TonB-dependent receptor plug domain-containing protein [Sphingomonadaceae bacterium]
MKFCSEVALAAAIGIVGYPAFAQDAGRGGGAGADPAAETGYADDVIVVTAQRRAENLQNVPIAVSVISNEQMDRGGATDVLDLGTQVPNLNLTSTAGYLSTSLRGIGSTGIGSAVENPVA